MGGEWGCGVSGVSVSVGGGGAVSGGRGEGGRR